MQGARGLESGGDKPPDERAIAGQPSGLASAGSPKLGSLDTIDAQIHNKIGLLESLLGSCDGVLRRHDDEAANGAHREAHAGAQTKDEEAMPAHRGHPGNPVIVMQLPQNFGTPRGEGKSKPQFHEATTCATPAATMEGERAHGTEHKRRKQMEKKYDMSSQHTIAPLVVHMIEAARLLRAQRVLCSVTRQLCGAHHVHCCLPSLRIHRLAQKQIRNMVSAEFGRCPSALCPHSCLSCAYTHWDTT